LGRSLPPVAAIKAVSWDWAAVEPVRAKAEFGIAAIRNAA
jgi:hypothetical protein